ncbi:MAG: ABC transporter permease subunit [Myxococcota bacterium]
MIPSFFKEVRSLLPFWMAFGALIAVTTLGDVFDGSLVLAPLGSRYDTGDAFFEMLLGILMGHGMVSHEYVSGHMEFLDALPTTRRQLYLGKVLAAAFVVTTTVIASALLSVGLDLLAPVPHQIPSWRPLIVQHLVHGAAMWFGVGAGMLLSWLRGLAFGVVVALVLLGTMFTFANPSFEAAIPLPDSGFGTLTFTRGLASHPPGPPLFWFVVGSACIAVSGRLFDGPGGRLVSRGSASMSRLRVAGGLSLAAMMVCSGFAGAIVTAQQLNVPEALRVADPEGPLRVLYRDSNADHVATLLPGLQSRLEAIAERLGSPVPRGPLDIEFLGTQRNHGGVYTGGKVRLRPDADAVVLTHELAHAVAFERLGLAAWEQKEHTRFFDEGLANWVADELEGDGEDPVAAGLVRSLGQARFDLLVDDGRLIYEQDIQEAYWLGEVFVRALVDVAGEPAIPCVLDALGSHGRRVVAGLALWYDAAERCGFDLDAVTDRWEARLDVVAERVGVPRLRVQRGMRDEEPVLEVWDEVGMDLELRCRFRADGSVPVDLYVQRTVYQGACAIPSLSGPTFDYQVGFVLDGTSPEPPGAFLPWVIDVRRDP